MLYITLVCAAGMSTSLLVNKMKEAAKKENIEAEIIAMSEAAFAKYDKPTDVLLLGPQVRYLLSKMKKTYEPRGMKVDVVDMRAYGLMDGKKVLDTALNMAKS
ncbi:MAG: PTS sugar transporter subunit IIB [Lachnospiraceae bacterium]|jgi:PTS system cellobiose-specific IIB component|uniref:PTS sugar transporter subunit IIB n=1 Tax=Candidatus Merdisoma sp. JLR.KK006 TaxID=3112626 RepID=UPI002FF1AC95|nr:PTS sugar transporter subunit IIB [Lachnospiraceae bacterium]MCI9251007.1 PTS sugar transporter subunit IIB [Lachnospiraceae bacterium]